MNILSITPLSFRNNYVNNRKNVNRNLNYVSNDINAPKLNSLSHDTVSFGSGAKELGQRTKEISYSLGKEIYAELNPMVKPFENQLKNHLKGLIANDAHPDNPIASIKGRAKSPLSLIEKALTRGFTTKNGIKQMGDAVGFRISLRSSSQKDFDKVLTGLGKMVKSGLFEVLEMENYRLTRNQSYVSSKTLDKFEQICQAKGQYPTRTGKAIPNGYTAFHLNIKFPNGQVSELQIMGRDLERVKDLEDFYYKLRCNKEFSPKYKPIYDIMTSKISKLDDFQKETLRRYIKDSYIHARELPARSSKHKLNSKDFLPIPYTLPEELGFSKLQEMKDMCDSAAKNAGTARKTTKQK